MLLYWRRIYHYSCDQYLKYSLQRKTFSHLLYFVDLTVIVSENPLGFSRVSIRTTDAFPCTRFLKSSEISARIIELKAYDAAKGITVVECRSRHLILSILKYPSGKKYRLSDHFLSISVHNIPQLRFSLLNVIALLAALVATPSTR